MSAALIVKWSIVAFLVVGTAATIATTGRPREPLTPGLVLAIVVINALIVVGIVTQWDTP